MSFPCPDCQQKFKNAAARNHHRWNQHAKIPPVTIGGKEYAVKREGDKLRCPVDRCMRSYASREAFTKHAKAAHGAASESPAPPSPPMGPSQRSTCEQEPSSVSLRSKGRILLHSLCT